MLLRKYLLSEGGGRRGRRKEGRGEKGGKGGGRNAFYGGTVALWEGWENELSGDSLLAVNVVSSTL